MDEATSIFAVFRTCVQAIKEGKLVVRESRQDKEFHFQNWFRARLEESGLHFDAGGRNSYPDFRLVKITEGYEVKGLAYPGREINYDCNSQAPTGQHNGRTVYYVFGRYPANPDGDSYPLLDLVLCHGDFLNADHEYVHKNKSVKGFGSYGDIMIRDRKMYVAPTPFGLTTGAVHQQTLILPADFPITGKWRKVGKLIRSEAEKLIVGYAFNLKQNKLTARTVPNPHAGKLHHFHALRLADGSNEPVTMRVTQGARQDEAGVDDDEE